MKRNPLLYFQDIANSIEKIEKYVCELSHEEFVGNSMVIDAVVRNFEIIGEAAARMPEDIRLTYNEIPWSEMKGIRNILIHEYFGVDLKILWKTIKQSLPELSTKINEAISNVNGDIRSAKEKTSNSIKQKTKNKDLER